MIGFGRNVTDPFDQNRSYAALGLSLGDGWSLEAGYLLQIVQRPGGQIVDFNHTLQLALFSSGGAVELRVDSCRQELPPAGRSLGCVSSETPSVVLEMDAPDVLRPSRTMA